MVKFESTWNKKMMNRADSKMNRADSKIVPVCVCVSLFTPSKQNESDFGGFSKSPGAPIEGGVPQRGHTRKLENFGYQEINISIPLNICLGWQYLLIFKNMSEYLDQIFKYLSGNIYQYF